MPMNPHVHRARKLLPFLSISLLLAALLASQATLHAQGPAPGKEDKTVALTDSMQRLVQDQMPAQDLAALTATPCVGGTAGGYPCENVDLLAFMPLSQFAAGSGNDSWGWTDPLDGTEYALMGLNNGTAFVDIGDPENPVYLGKLPTHTSSSSWRDIKVYGNYAFIVSEAGGHGMQVFDLTSLRNVVNPPVTFSETAHYGGFGNAHNIVVNQDSGYAYAVGTSTCSGGLHMVDIQNPLNPTNAGCFSSDGYTHDAQCVNYSGPDPDYQGREICFNFNEDTLTIVDVTNKAAPTQVSRTGYPNSAYTHQGWVDETQSYLLLDDELDEQSFGYNTRTRIWDISDLDQPALLGYYSGSTTAIDHNLYIKDGYAYQANYRAGLQIINLADIANANLSQEAYFDIYPSSNSASFNGAWNVFPYFDSGVVIVSGIEQGLFILRPTLAPDFSMSAGDTILAVCAPGSDATILTLNSLNGYGGSVTLGQAGLPAGATASFSPNPVTVPGSSTLTVDVGSVASGNYPFTVSGSDGSLTHDLGLALNAANAAAGTPALLSPPDGAGNQPVQPTFTWSAASDAVSYRIDIATDAAFSTIVDTASDILSTSYTPATSLPSDTTLYWRVQASNACGTGSYSPTFSFNTLVCATPNLPIPDNSPVGVTDVLNVAAGGPPLSDLNVSILASHTWVGDIAFTLTHVDTGTSVTVFDRPGVPGSTFGCSGNDVDATLDDEAATPVENECGGGTPTIQGSFIPNNPLSAFDGEDPGGQWSLTAADFAGGDTGTLIQWCLIPGEACYDFNGTGQVDAGDVQRVAGAWGTSDPLYDLDGNGTVGVEDVQLAAESWQVACSR